MALQKVDKLIKYIDDNFTLSESKDDYKEDISSIPSSISSTLPILILGSGLCVPSCVIYLNNLGYKILIATRTPSRSQKIFNKCKYPQLCKSIALDMSNEQSARMVLDKIVKDCSIVVSMLPWIYHGLAAEYALKYSKNFANSSYIQPAMAELDKKVKEKNLVFLNECGLDPGLDHIDLIAARDDAIKNGGIIKSMISICGGLPAPEYNDNPLGYKFSWAPRGVLLAGKNYAEQLLNNKKIKVKNKDLFTTTWTEEFPNIGKNGITLDWYFNRNSLKYIDIYGKLEGIRTMIRATYRYQGWCPTLKLFCDLDLGNDEKRNDIKGKTFKEFFTKYLDIKKNETFNQCIIRRTKCHPNNIGLKNLNWINLMDNQKIPNNIDNTVIDLVCYLCESKMQYKPGEKDMVILKNSYDILYKDGYREKKISTMICFGDTPLPGWTLPQGVALPLAVGIKLILQNKVTTRGVVAPITPDIYKPIQQECNKIYSKCSYEIEKPEIWIRSENNINSCLINLKTTQLLLNNNFNIIIESSNNRLIKDNEFKNIGAKIVNKNSFSKDAGFSTYVVGISELPKIDDEYQSRYIYFADKTSVDMYKLVGKNEGEILNLSDLDSFNGVSIEDGDKLADVFYSVILDVVKRDSKLRNVMRNNFLKKVNS